MQGLSIIIPIYNEEDSISNTLQQIINVLKPESYEYEILAINDGSSDNSLQEIENFPSIKVISHKINKGYGASIKTGLRIAKYKSICITDADGTYPNELIPKLYNELREKHLDMVVGARTGENVTYPFLKKIPKFFIIGLANYISETKIPDINSGLRIFDKDIALKYFHLYPNGFSFTTTITLSLLCSGYEVSFEKIDYFERIGKSKIRPIKDTANFFKLLLKIALYFNPFKFFKPLILIFALLSILAFSRDLFVLQDLTQSSLLFSTFTLLFFSLGLLADLIIKRTQ